MSIDAIITAVIRDEGGKTATLVLTPRDPRDRHHGNARMRVINPPEQLEAAIGTHVWGSANTLMVGETKWAERIGYTTCRLVTPPGRR